MDILTPWKVRDRLSREVYTSDGAPDAAVRLGMYHRAWNPRNTHLNSRDGKAGSVRMDESSVYFGEDSYRDRAGKVYHGRVRLQSVCRRLVWGRTIRLQCPPCHRYLPSGSEVACKRCGTIYVDEGATACV